MMVVYFCPHVYRTLLGYLISSKAVSDGAVIWCATTSVLARACRFSFGHPDHLLYNPEDPDHLDRGAQVLPDGSARVKGAFDTLAVRVSWQLPRLRLVTLFLMNPFFLGLLGNGVQAGTSRQEAVLCCSVLSGRLDAFVLVSVRLHAS